MLIVIEMQEALEEDINFILLIYLYNDKLK